MISGFKCFYSGLVNRYGEKLELDKKYVCNEPVKFQSKGYHICANLEDTLRYFDFNREIDICEAIGYPEYVKYDDEYYGYYDMYVCQGLLLKRKLTREEILQMADSMSVGKFKRFSKNYKLTEEEYEYFKNKYRNNIDVTNHLIYYYEDKNIYSKVYRR